MIKTIHGVLALLTVTLISTQAHAEIVRFMQVSPGVYRGGQPRTSADYQKLKNLGVKTLLNLRHFDKIAAKEFDDLKGTGMDLIHIPMMPVKYPNNHDVKHALKVLTDPHYAPVFIHCKDGKDRTGMVMALYRIHVQGWSPQAAYEEMIEIGFWKPLIMLKKYFWNHSQELGFDL